MLVKEVLGVQIIRKDDKVYTILHTATVDPVTKDGFAGRMCENIFVNNPDLIPSELKVGSKIRIYYDNVGGKAYLQGIEICK